jgi:hypothetical protein
VDDDIEQLLDLGLELEFLRRGCGHRKGVSYSLCRKIKRLIASNSDPVKT